MRLGRFQGMRREPAGEPYTQENEYEKIHKRKNSR